MRPDVLLNRCGVLSINSDSRKPIAWRSAFASGRRRPTFGTARSEPSLAGDDRHPRRDGGPRRRSRSARRVCGPALAL